MVELLDIPETITYSLSNVKLILVTNNYFVEINEVIKGLRPGVFGILGSILIEKSVKTSQKSLHLNTPWPMV